VTSGAALPRRPRIVLVVASLEVVGGQSVAAAHLARALGSEGYDVTWLPIDPQLPAWLRGVRRFRGLRTLVNQMLFLPSLLRLARHDVVHVFSASYWSFLLAPAPAMLTGRLLAKRVILHYHSGEAADHLANWGWAVHPWLRLAHEIVVPSAYLGKVFASHGYEVRVIPNLFDPSQFSYRERATLRPSLLSTRNLEPHYAVATSIEAFVIVQREYPEATFTIVGAGSEMGRLREMANAMGLTRVRFLGQITPDRMAAVLDEADVFLNASVIDNQPLSILEAFAAGLPVVSTPTGAIGEMVHDGRTGILVPPGSPNAMATAVLTLLDRPATAVAIARSARQELRNYTWPVVRPAWAAAYGASAGGD